MTPSPVPPGVLTPLRGGDPSASNDVDQHHFGSSPVNQPYINNQCRNSMSISNTKGLLNMPGQNNCFLNSAVQVLWHLDIFRRSFRELTGHACMAESCIFCALKELFAQFQYSRETALPPDALRRALAETFFDQRRFQLGFMDDAAECFENILLRIHCHIASQESEDMCSAGHCIPHQKFAMTLVEQTVCHACGATSEPLPFSQMVHYVSASALCTQAILAKQKGIQPSDAFGILMKTAGGMGDVRDCPSSCGAKIQIQKTLMNNPEILSVGLVWDSERPTLDHIMDVFDTIGLSIKLQDVFHSVVDKSWACATVHNLVGVVTYYGKHYSTFFFHSKLGVWIYFDDAAVREIGPHWEQVVEKCRRGHFQPLLLLYADPNGTPVSVGSAPRCITYIPGQKKIPGPNPLTDHLKGRLSRSGTPSDLLCGGLTPTPHMTYLNADPIANQGSDSGSRSLDENCTCREDKRSYEECDIHGTYISRKAVEHVLNFQKLQRQRSLNGSFTSGHGSVGSRNSSSSLESFENNNALQQQQQMLQQQQQKMNTAIDLHKIKTVQMSHPPLGMTVNLPRRRDSGNWSGDRNSASSASSTSLDNPYAFNVSGRRPLYGPGGQMMKNRLDPACLLMSDQGYDSFSLSSTDSYPSIGNASPLRIDNRLGQILENVQLDLPKGSNNKNNSDIQNSSQNKAHLSCMEDCDKLCAEADTLLKKSNEKEQEGDLAMAALYSDAAAAKARQAMDAPYNNAQSMVSAKMKHSLCVMRSSNIHRRIKEAEAEERRRQKEQQGALEIHHHRQSSRDSNHSRHSRQSSRDSGKLSGSLSKSTGSSHSRQGSVENFEKLGRGIELYATLPKKGAKKKSCSYEDVLSTNFNEEFCKPELKNSGSASPQTPVVSRTTTSKKNNDISEFFYSKEPPETTGDYWTRQEPVPQASQPKSKSPLNRTLSGPANLKDTSEQVKESLTQNKKQHKIRRKLMGGLMRRKNRSLPDLREGQDQINDGGVKSSAYDDSELVLGLISPKSRERKMLNVANVTTTSDYLSEDNSYVSRGFHQPHRAFVNRDFYQRPLLMKVNPPKVENISMEPELVPSPSVQVQHQPIPSVQHQPMPTIQVQHQPIQSVQVQNKLSRVTPTDFNYQQNKPEVIYQNQAVHNQLMRQKALEQQQRNVSNERTLAYDSLMSPMIERRVMNKTKVEPIPPVRESSLYNTYEQDCNLAKRKTLATSAEELPIANSSFLAELQAKRSQILESSPSNNKSNVTNEISKGKWLEELQKKQQELLHQKQKEVAESVNQLTNVAPPPLTQVSHHVGPNQIQGFDLRDGAYASHQTPMYNTAQSVLPKPLQRSKDDNESKSVKDLASRFEHILYVKPQTMQSQLEVVSNNKSNDLRELNTSRGPYEVKPVPKLNDRTNLVPGRLFTLTSTMSQQATHYPAPFSPSPSQSCHNESANETRSSPSIPAALRDPSPMTQLTGHKLSPSPQECDLRRPQRPPDYETAIQRLGLIRDIRSASPMENNNNTATKPCHESQNAVQQEPPKKNRGTKKSVTFSDQVVLVACADDEESDYLPNPLLERVYKQHSMRTESDQIVPQIQIVNSSEDTVLCNLCHQQRVKVQNVYCPDCSFYVARFSPKK